MKFDSLEHSLTKVFTLIQVKVVLNEQEVEEVLCELERNLLTPDLAKGLTILCMVHVEVLHPKKHFQEA